jgi:VWFA-related protein
MLIIAATVHLNVGRDRLTKMLRGSPLSKVSVTSLLILMQLSPVGLWSQQQIPPPPIPTMPQPPPQSQSSEDSSPAQQGRDKDQDPAATFKVGVDVVQLFFNVKDKKGALIPDQTKDNFQVFEDNKPQIIKYFSSNSNLPLTLGILIDTSASQTRVLDAEKEVGGAFLRNVLKEKDMAFVLSFDVDVRLLQDFTSSTHALQSALNETRIGTGAGAVASQIPGVQGPIPTSGMARGTLLYDAVYLAAHDELSQEVGRKAMILLTDGEDQGSQLRLKEAIEAAQKADSICYVLLIADRDFYGGSYSGAGEMAKMAKETGGRMIEVGNRVEKLKDAFDQIAKELRSQYSMGYTPTNAVEDGGFRKIEIRSTNGYKIQARSGYYARPAKN